MRKRRPSLERKRRVAGFFFVLPWIIGFVGMFMRSLIESLIYSVSTTTITSNGMQTVYKGFGSYNRAFFIDTNFVRFLTDEITGMLPQVLIILAFSLLMGVILSGSFKGRTFVRSVFFLPVICGSGLILSIMNGDAMSSAIMSGSRSAMLFQTSGIDQFLLKMGVGSDLVNTMMGIVNGIFDLTWKSGLQILLFISGIMSISPALYEAAKIEGATAWESFWKITFPMLSPILVLNAVYSIIDRFTDYGNKVMQHILSFAKGFDFSYSSALAWIYFLVMGILVSIFYIIVNKRIVYTVE
ncbi:MAG: sugar ABC transporter permease [Clostridiales bacterium]|nr:sugar ABC transporter permease [Clostridiales bacterium]